MHKTQNTTDAKTALLTLPYSPFTRIISWREKRKDERLSALMEDLAPQLVAAEQRYVCVCVCASHSLTL